MLCGKSQNNSVKCIILTKISMNFWYFYFRSFPLSPHLSFLFEKLQDWYEFFHWIVRTEIKWHTDHHYNMWTLCTQVFTSTFTLNLCYIYKFMIIGVKSIDSAYYIEFKLQMLFIQTPHKRLPIRTFIKWAKTVWESIALSKLDGRFQISGVVNTVQKYKCYTRE